MLWACCKYHLWMIFDDSRITGLEGMTEKALFRIRKSTYSLWETKDFQGQPSYFFWGGALKFDSIWPLILWQKHKNCDCCLFCGKRPPKKRLRRIFPFDAQHFVDTVTNFIPSYNSISQNKMYLQCVQPQASLTFNTLLLFPITIT